MRSRPRNKSCPRRNHWWNTGNTFHNIPYSRNNSRHLFGRMGERTIWHWRCCIIPLYNRPMVYQGNILQTSENTIPGFPFHSKCRRRLWYSHFSYDNPIACLWSSCFHNWIEYNTLHTRSWSIFPGRTRRLFHSSNSLHFWNHTRGRIP